MLHVEMLQNRVINGSKVHSTVLIICDY